MIRSRLQARTSSLPRSVRPGPVSGEDGQRNGTPWPKTFGRLHTGPSERRPAWCSTSSASNSGSIASAPSMCRTAASTPSSMQCGCRRRCGRRGRARPTRVRCGTGSTPCSNTAACAWRDRAAAASVRRARAATRAARRRAGLLLLGRGHEDRKHAAGKSALPRHRQIELAFAFAVEKRRAPRPGRLALEQAQQRVVVAVEDRNALGRGHRWWSFVYKIQYSRLAQRVRPEVAAVDELRRNPPSAASARWSGGLRRANPPFALLRIN